MFFIFSILFISSFKNLHFSQTLIINNYTSKSFFFDWKNSTFSILPNKSKKLDNFKKGNIVLKNEASTEKELNLFLKKEDTLIINLENNGRESYIGNKGKLHEYINYDSHIKTFEDINKYKKNYFDKKKFVDLINFNLNQNQYIVNKLNSDREENNRIVTYIEKKILFSIINVLKSSNNKELNTDYTKYLFITLLKRIPSTNLCSDYYDFYIENFFAENENRAKNNLEIYKIISVKNSPSFFKYLSPRCQKFYFENTMQYLKSIDNIKYKEYENVIKNEFTNN